MATKEEKNLTSQFFSDQRGELYVNKIQDVEFNVIFTKAGVYRAGDYHPGEQYSVILKGQVEITLRQNDQDVLKKYGPNELIVIPKDTPHLYKFLADTVMMEWLAGSYKPQYYAPYRKIILEQLEKLKNKLS